MARRRPFALLVSSLAVVAAAALPATPASASALPWPGSDSIRLAVADGQLAVSLRPDGGRALRLLRDHENRWVFAGDTGGLVGEPYAIVLRNDTSERLKVVVGVDGLNVYEREVVSGNARDDVGSILAPWSERVLRGWQIGDHRAQRFVFSPNEWSEGQGRTESRIGLVTVQVYREWREPRWRHHDEEWRDGGAAPRPSSGAPRGAHPVPEPAPQSAPDSAQEGAEARPSARASRPREPIGTTAGDDVASSVRTVRFAAATMHPEAWAVIDYGGAAARHPHPRWPEDDLLGLDLAPGRDGARIVAVAPGSAAERAGLEPYDVIVRLDALHAPTPEAARRLLRAKDRGDYAFLRVRRGSHELAVKIRV